MFVNARVAMAELTGVGRYLEEMLGAWPGPPPERISPPGWAGRGLAGHCWEQSILPLRARGDLLWSPVHSGPIALEAQVVTVHDVVPLDHPEWLNPRFARWYRFMLPRLVHRARHVITVSEFTRSRLMATTGLDAGRISVIHSGVGTRFRPASERMQTRMRQYFGLGDVPFFLCLGSLEPRKNVSGLLQAWNQALPKLPADLHLVLAGAAGRAQVFGKSRALELPQRVMALGRVDDEWLPALYSAAEWFAYISHYEGFGLPLLEALACGTPVLASDLDVFREVLGGNAVGVRPDDVEDIAAGLVRAARDGDLKNHLAAAAIGQASKFDWQTTAARTHEVLQEYR